MIAGNVQSEEIFTYFDQRLRSGECGCFSPGPVVQDCCLIPGGMVLFQACLAMANFFVSYSGGCLVFCEIGFQGSHGFLYVDLSTAR